MISWKVVEIEKSYRGSFEPLDHKIIVRYGCKGGSSLSITADICKEVAADRFTLLQSGRVFALAPDSNGKLYLSKNKRIAGMSKSTILKVLTICGLDPDKQKHLIDAVVDDGLIVFPKKRYEMMK